jgi:hypothetical protein
MVLVLGFTEVIVRIPIVLLIGPRPDVPEIIGPANVCPGAKLEVELTWNTIGLVKKGTPAVVVVRPEGVADCMSRFGEKRVPDEKRIPLPDWYLKAFLD